MNDKLLKTKEEVDQNMFMLQFEFIFMEILQQLKIQ